MSAPTLAAAPVFVAEAADWLAVEVGVTIGVEVAGKVVMLELGEAVTEFTRIRVLVIVVVDWEVVSSATATWAAAMQRKEVKRALICILANGHKMQCECFFVENSEAWTITAVRDSEFLRHWKVEGREKARYLSHVRIEMKQI